MSKGVWSAGRSEADQGSTPPDVRLAWRAAEQHGVVSIAQLHACGLDKHAIAVRLRRGSLHRVHRGVYAVGHASLTLQARLMAAVLACGPHAVLSHRSAAAHWGFMRWEDQVVEVDPSSSKDPARGRSCAPLALTRGAQAAAP